MEAPLFVGFFCNFAVMVAFLPTCTIRFGGPAMPAKATILYVEDNSDNRKLVRRVLEVEGYAVVEAQDGHEAMERLESESIDLALMDINMPEMDGYTLTSRIKAMPRFSKLPIVAVTANVMRGDRERSLEAGCDGYIQKPIDIDTLSQQIERFLTRNANA
jgi:two-component system cell cycle response regulator DivK